jgi:hypothetical protein
MGRPRKSFSDPVFCPEDQPAGPLLADLAAHGWSTGRVAAALLTAHNTVKRWVVGTSRPTYGYMQALLRLHRHVCGEPAQLRTKIPGTHAITDPE